MDTEIEALTLIVIGSSRKSRMVSALESIDGVTLETSVWEGRDGRRTLRELWRLRKSITEHDNPAILTDSMGGQAFQAGTIAHYYDIPFIIRARGGMWKEYRDNKHHLNKSQRFVYSFLKERLRNANLRLADAVLPVSYFHKLQIIEELDLSYDDLYVVYEPVNYAQFSKPHPKNTTSHFGLNPNAKVLLTITTFGYKNKYEGILDYIETIIQFLSENPDWVFVACGPGGGKSRVEQKFKNHADDDIIDRIAVLGYQKNIANLYNSSDIYVHLSYRDSMGLTVLEAQAAALPVIVNHGGGPIELVRQGGKVNFIANSEEDLLSSLSTLASNEKLRHSIGEINQKWVQNKFSFESIGEMFSSAFNGMDC